MYPNICMHVLNRLSKFSIVKEPKTQMEFKGNRKGIHKQLIVRINIGVDSWVKPLYSFLGYKQPRIIDTNVSFVQRVDIQNLSPR